MEPLVLDQALSALEALEMRSLTWGFIDQSLSEREACDAIEATLAANARLDPSDVLDALCTAMLVRMLTDSHERRYRTRFAEIVRLLARSRQWFDGQAWQVAPTLVSDFRVDTRLRHYPDRNIPSAVAWAQVAQPRQLTSLQFAVWQALVGTTDLSVFQVDAARRLLAAPRGSGTIITAGTGSGKTLSFYLPALIAIAPEVRKDEQWTKAVCIYPRQELLKDQLSEAYKLARQAAGTLTDQGRRPLVFASLFGPTPSEATEASVAEARWAKTSAGFVCPYLRCPACGAHMLWPREALREQREMLRCVERGCHTQVDGATLRLTRRSLRDAPADLLFTTTEMINQRLSDTHMQHLFGVNRPDGRAPLYALLDEVHTYAGVSGAQVALLLRRWAALLNVKLRWAGLSATLPQPSRFFADLTGAKADEVVCIAPAAEHMISRGAEYNLVLRSDASSQVATLSTSIQAVMLLSRMLDPPGRGDSAGRFGSRTFVFTDDLDVTNRLFDNLLDAEAYNRWRHPDDRRKPLAALRAGTRPERLERERDGQCWDMAEILQASLDTRLRVGRTSSRDPGVDAEANVIVATSTLEVGFNDPSVGAVFQHKAPRSAASFLQRRGRAGRDRRMRPLTITVLSDYGRDRVAFQSYEDLFNPTVEIQSLPIKNLYVLRMQAVYATLDWIAREAPARARGWAWRTFAGPDLKPSTYPPFQAFQAHAKDMVRRLARLDPATIDALRTYLRTALQIDATLLESVLWDPPRSLLLEALPTLARRVFRDWQLAEGGGLDLHRSSPPHPLPDFVPANLFSDLNLPEVQIVIPGVGREAGETAAMPIVQALQQFVPGRVRRRFADVQAKVSHWMPLDLTQPSQDVSIGAYARRHEYLGRCGQIAVYRPWELQVARSPTSVHESSNARWEWCSHFEERGDPTRISLPQVGGTALMQRLEFRLHRFSSALSLWRFAPCGQASVKVNQREQRFDFRLVDAQQAPAAVGFVFEADALLVPFTLPSAEQLARLPLTDDVIAWLRYLALTHYVDTDATLTTRFNSFLRDWLQQIVLATGVVIAERDHISLDAGLEQLVTNPGQERFAAVITGLVAANRTPWPEDDDNDNDNDDDATPGAAVQSRLAMSLQAALADPQIVTCLVGHVRRWIAPDAFAWQTWLEHLAQATLGESIYQACVAAAPQSAAAEGLTVDVDATDGQLRAIVAETTLGGGGVIEALAETFAADPRAFLRGLESACSPSDREMAAAALRRVVRLLAMDASLRDGLARLRSAQDTQTREIARSDFFHALANHGVPASRTLSMLMATRLVRPGATPDSDGLTGHLLDAWDALERKYEIAFPCRLAAALIGLTQRIAALTRMGGVGREIMTAGLLLWPWGGELRQRALQSYNPYRSAPYVDAALARVMLFDGRLPVVELDAPQWHSQTVQALATYGIVRLVARHSDTSWRARVTGLLDTPVVSGFLQFYPLIEATRVLSDGRLAVDLLLRDRV